MRFFIDAKLLFILLIVSVAAILVLLLRILIFLLMKRAYVTNIIWLRDRFLVWLLSIWLFGISPIWLASILWLIAYFLLKDVILKKDICCRINLYDSQTNITCKSFRECIENLFLKPTNDFNIKRSELSDWFGFGEYTNTLLVVPVYYLFGIVSLYPDRPIGFVIGLYLIAISTYVLIARGVYAILNQPGNFFEEGLYSCLFLIALGMIYFGLWTWIINNLGYFNLL